MNPADLLKPYDLSPAGVREVLRHPATDAETRLANATLGLVDQLCTLPSLLRGVSARDELPHAATSDEALASAIDTLRASGAKRLRLEWLDADDRPIRTATPEEDQAHLVIYQTAIARAHEGLDQLDAIERLTQERDAADHELTRLRMKVADLQGAQESLDAAHEEARRWNARATETDAELEQRTRERDEARALAEAALTEGRLACEKAREDRAFTEEWYGTRWHRLAELLRGTAHWPVVCDIMANGTAGSREPPTYAQTLAKESFRAEDAEREVAKLRQELGARTAELTMFETLLRPKATDAQPHWRLVCEGEDVPHAVTVTQMGKRFRATVGTAFGESQESAHDAVLRFVAKHHWPVRQVVPPGQKTLAELAGDAARQVGRLARLKDAAEDKVARLEKSLHATECHADELAAQRLELAKELDRYRRAVAEGLPRELILCPKCGARHIDGANGAEFATRPHHTHLCAGCGHVWDAKRWSFGAADAQLAAIGSVVTDEHLADAIHWLSQCDFDGAQHALRTVEQLVNDLHAVRGERDALRTQRDWRLDHAVREERVACMRLCAEHRARYADTENGWPHNNYATHQKAAEEIEDAIRQRGNVAPTKRLSGAEALERLAEALPNLVNATDEELDLMENFGSPSNREDALTALNDLKDAAGKAYLAMDHRAGDTISAEVDGDAEPCLALHLSLLPGDAPTWQAMVLYSGGMGLVPVIAGDPHVDALDAARSLRAQIGLAQTREEPAGE